MDSLPTEILSYIFDCVRIAEHSGFGTGESLRERDSCSLGFRLRAVSRRFCSVSSAAQTIWGKIVVEGRSHYDLRRFEACLLASQPHPLEVRLEDNRIFYHDLEVDFLPDLLATISREMARVAKLYVTLAESAERTSILQCFQDLCAPRLELLAIDVDLLTSSDDELEDSETNLPSPVRGDASFFKGGAPKLATLQYTGLGFLSAQVPLGGMMRISIGNPEYNQVADLQKLSEMVSSAPRLQTLELYGDYTGIYARSTIWNPTDPSYGRQVEAAQLKSLIVDDHTQAFLSVLKAPSLTHLDLRAVDMPKFIEFLSCTHELRFPCLVSLTLTFVDTPPPEVLRALMLGLPNIDYFALLETGMKRNSRLLCMLADETHLWPALHTVKLFGAEKFHFTRLLQTRGSGLTLRTVVLSSGFVSRIGAVRDVAQAFDVAIHTFEWPSNHGINRYGHSWGVSGASALWYIASSDEEDECRVYPPADE